HTIFSRDWSSDVCSSDLHHTVFAAILGTGCGAGISVNGQLLTGPNGVAGEWGHNPLPWTPETELQPRPCFCGRYGCIETFLSGTGLSLTHKLRTGQQQPAHIIVENARNGDPQAIDTSQQYLEHLARGLAAVINVLDPDIKIGSASCREREDEAKDARRSR